MLIGQYVKMLVLRVKAYRRECIYIILLINIIFFHSIQICVNHVHAGGSDHDSLVIIQGKMLWLPQKRHSELMQGLRFLSDKIQLKDLVNSRKYQCVSLETLFMLEEKRHTCLVKNRIF